jgi:tetratricopeptide (TPR) repeat protein
VFASAPENPDAINAAAYVLQMQGKLDEALLLLRKSLNLSTRNRQGHAMMARTLIRLGRFDEAAPHLAFMHSWSERSREHGPFDHRLQAIYYALFADAAFLQGDEDKAYEWLQRWAAEMPYSGRPYLVLAAIDALKGRDEQANAHMKRHLELLPHSNLSYVAMQMQTSNPAIAERYARLFDAMRKAGLPEGAS